MRHSGHSIEATPTTLLAATAAVVLAIKGATKDKEHAARSSIAECTALPADSATTTAAVLHCDAALQTDNAAALMSRLMPLVGNMKTYQNSGYRAGDGEKTPRCFRVRMCIPPLA